MTDFLLKNGWDLQEEIKKSHFGDYSQSATFLVLFVLFPVLRRRESAEIFEGFMEVRCAFISYTFRNLINRQSGVCKQFFRHFYAVTGKGIEEIFARVSFII